VSKYNSSRELALKMDSEGGLAEMLFGYGLDADDLPDDMRPDIRENLLKLKALADEYDSVQSWLYSEMDEPPRIGDWDWGYE